MHRLGKTLFWVLVFIVVLVGLDQVLTRVPPVHPAHAAFSDFYRDFRSRLFSIIVVLPEGGQPTVESVIDKEREAVRQSPTQSSPKQGAALESTAQPGKPGRFVYADDHGVLQFADSLDDVPKAYRASAEPLSE